MVAGEDFLREGQFLMAIRLARGWRVSLKARVDSIVQVLACGSLVMKWPISKHIW